MENFLMLRRFGLPVSVAPGRSVIVAWLVLNGGANLLAQGDLRDIPVPDPAAEQAAMIPDPAAAVNLFAADPDIRKPIQINFDSRGRLWVASSEVYPQISPGEKANDKIIVLEDTTGDGIADHSTVFAEGLLIPTGVVPDGKGGAYVAASTELLHFEDTDGDGRADRKRVVLSGFGTEDTHHLVHTLRWGPDGCLYFNQSIYIHSHIETAYGTRHLEGGGIWRYRPETGQLEVFCKGFVNPWGHVFDALGESFVTDGAYFEGINYAFPDAVFVTSPGATRWLSGLNPGSPKHCGLEILSGRHIPPQWAGDLVTSDFRGHRVCRFTVRPSQSTFTSRQQPEILKTSHVAFRPIDARMGPDGALYVADWYNPIIQHGEVDFRDDRRDRLHGRIWRVSFPDRPLDPWPDFSALDRDQLLSLLEDPSLAVRQFARQQLWPMVRQSPDTVLAAARRWRQMAGDAKAERTRALEQQWLGEVAGRFEREAFLDVQRGPSDEVTRTSLRSAVRIAGLGDEDVRESVDQAIVGDHGPTRLEAIVALGQTNRSRDGNHQTAAEALITAAEVRDDDVIDFALWQSLRSTSPRWIDLLSSGQLQWRPHAEGLAFAVTSARSPEAAGALLAILDDRSLSANDRETFVSAIAQSGDPATLGKLLKKTLGDDLDAPLSSIARFTLERLLVRTRSDRTVPDQADSILSARVASLVGDDAVGRWGERLGDPQTFLAIVGAWRSSALMPALLKWLDRSPDIAIRTAAIDALGNFDSPEAKRTLDRWAQYVGEAEATTAVKAIMRQRPQVAAVTAAALVCRIQSDSLASELVVTLKSNKGTAKPFATALQDVDMSADRARVLLTNIRSAGGDEAIESAIRQAGKLDDAGWKWSDTFAAEILTDVRKGGDPAAGEQVYRRAALQCVACHAIGTAGGLVGPNLISLGSASQLDYILESLIEPSAKLKEGYSTLTILTDDGRVTSGIAIGRDEETLQLRLADGAEVTLRTDTIEEESPGKSLMPAGLLDSLTKSELVDLVAFLAALGRDPNYTVSTEPIIRSFETLVYSPESNRYLNRTSIDSAATSAAMLQWRMVTTTVDGRLPIDELDVFKPHQTTPPISFVRWDLEVPPGETTGLDLPPADGLSVWINERPVPLWALEQKRFEPGKHRVVLGIHRRSPGEDVGAGIPISQGQKPDGLMIKLN